MLTGSRLSRLSRRGAPGMKWQRVVVLAVGGIVAFGAACWGPITRPEAPANSRVRGPSAVNASTSTFGLPSLTPAPGVSGDPARGRQLILAAGCAGCHTVPGVPGATGVARPHL